MPDRAIIPLIAGVTFGFIAGLIASVQQLSTATVVEIALVVGLASGFAGAASVAGTEGAGTEKRTIGLLRGGLAAALSALIVFAMTRFLGDGNVALGLLLLVLAGVVALPLVRLRVRGPRTD